MYISFTKETIEINIKSLSILRGGGGGGGG